MQPRYRVSAAALIAGAGLTVGGAEAAPTPFLLSATGDGFATQTISFSKFDSSLGTLTGVTFSLTSSETLKSGFSLTGGEGGTGSASMSVSFEINGPGAVSSTLFSGLGGATSSCTDTVFPYDCTNLVNDTTTNPSFTSPFPVPLADLGSYVGVGMFDVVLDMDLFDVGVASCISARSVAPTCTATAEATWSGELEVTFLFTPNPGDPPSVPEPGSLGVLAFSLAGLIAVTRRRRSPAA
jgi:hypothetical protein